MKMTLIAMGLGAAGLLALPATSHAVDGDNGGMFLNGGIGQSSLDNGAYNDNDTGYDANIGYRWALNPSAAIGIEGGYTDLGKFQARSSLTGFPGAKVDGWTLGVNGHFNLTPQWYISGRAGMFRADVKAAIAGTPAPVLIDDTSNKYYAGAGFGYDFSNNLSLGLNYDHYKVSKSGFSTNPDLVSVNAELRF